MFYVEQVNWGPPASHGSGLLSTNSGLSILPDCHTQGLFHITSTAVALAGPLWPVAQYRVLDS